MVSCSQNEKKETSVKAQDAADIVGESSVKTERLGFNELLKELSIKTVPLIDATNFDTFIEERKIYNKEEVQVLQLEKMYPNYYKEGHNYRATPNYKMDLSKNFYSIVTTIFKGENEMESVLINYDLKGKMIDSKVISYDEIAEGMFKIESKIEQNKLTINSIADMEEKSEEIAIFKIDAEGKIKLITQTNEAVEGIDPIEEAILQLSLNRLKIKKDLVVSRVQPHNPNESIVVLPEIVDEGEQYFELNSHILIVDNTTGKITHKYFESYQTNNWFSDAVILSTITIDTAPYILAENTRAFGIRLYRYNRSQPNPYSNRTISLFVTSGDTLKKVLSNYDVMNYGGEWDTDCVGEFTDIKNTLIMSKQITNGYFDILVKSKITKTKNFTDENGECDDNKKVSTKTTVLKFNGEEYVSHDN